MTVESTEPHPHMDSEARLSSECAGRASLANENDLIAFQFRDYEVGTYCVPCLAGSQPKTRFAIKIFLSTLYGSYFGITVTKMHKRNKSKEERFALAHGFRDVPAVVARKMCQKVQWLFMKKKVRVWEELDMPLYTAPLLPP